jgi:ABC-2 type transport system permease protein
VSAGNVVAEVRRRGRSERSGERLRAFLTATRLGWQMEANWTDPLLFFIYSVAKPVSAALILIVMLQVIGGEATARYRGFVVVGTALWSVVLSGVAGLAWAILDDRERYRMLKYLYVSPAALFVVLVGRGGARLAAGAMGTAVALLFAVIVLGLRIDVARVDWLLLVVSLVLGLVPIIALGMMLAAVCLQTRQESWSYPEAVAGALFLLVGAVFPLSVLPAPAQVLGLLVPLTWWLETVRRALFPGTISAIGGPGSVWTTWTGTAAPDTVTCLIGLLLTTALVTLVALGAYRWSEHRAKERGLFDQTTGS